tara:strand:+ start:35 stop:448 length:414 start_codon:yes stop_codon:yes gene_type:complete
MPEKDYTYNEQLLLEAVKSTYGIPTVALSALAVTGAFAGMKLATFLSSLSLPTINIPALPDLPSTLDTLNVGITSAEKPKFASDGLACLAAHPKNIDIPILGSFPDPLRGGKIAACMVAKGWGDDAVIQWLRNYAGV